MNAYVNIEPNHKTSDARLVITIVVEGPTSQWAVQLASHVIRSVGEGGYVNVDSESITHRPMIVEMVAEALSSNKAVRVRR